MLKTMHTITKRALALATPAVLSAGLLAGCSSSGGSSDTSASASATAPTTTDATASTDTGAATEATVSTTAADSAAFAQLETQFHAQLGLYAINTGTGRSVAYQADQRFAYCSTIKAFAASVLLQRDTDQQLSQVIKYSKSDLVDYSPVTSEHVGTGMTLSAIMAAALDISDNTALNLMLNQIGGPAALQSALRSLGDTTTNVDRTEPTLNSATPGDTRDTSTARALATDLRTFVLGDALTTSRRAQLVTWLKANTTGGPYIRAAMPGRLEGRGQDRQRRLRHAQRHRGALAADRSARSSSRCSPTAARTRTPPRTTRCSPTPRRSRCGP
jgi:beta-lactamase class A